MSTLGTRLLHRTTRHTSLTAEGQLFYERVTQIMSDVYEAKTLFVGTDAQPKGKLRIDLPVQLARSLIVPHLKEFHTRYPEVDLIVGVSDNPVDLIAEGIDCVVRIGELPSSSMIGRRVGSVPLVVCGSPAYLAEYGTPTSLDDLTGHRVVNFFSGRARKVLSWQFLVDGEEVPLRLKSGILVNDSDAYVAGGLAGFGLMQALGISVAPHLESGALVEVLADLQPPPRPVSVLYPSRRYLSPQVRVFVEWVSAIFSTVDGRWITHP